MNKSSKSANSFPSPIYGPDGNLASDNASLWLPENMGDASASCPIDAPCFPGASLYTDPSLYKYGGNHLPHWDFPSTVYHVCFRLADSIPAQLIDKWHQEVNDLIRQFNMEQDVHSIDNRIYIRDFIYNWTETYLDICQGSCVLKYPQVADIVQKSLEFFNGTKYTLHAWCIMPNHVHIMVQAAKTFSLDRIFQSWKSFTAHEINKLLGQKGQLWQVDSYNRIIRSRNEYFYQVRYIWNNPVRAGLAQWKWRWKKS